MTHETDGAGEIRHITIIPLQVEDVTLVKALSRLRTRNSPLFFFISWKLLHHQQEPKLRSGLSVNEGRNGREKQHDNLDGDAGMGSF
ncbi:hypothetical protein EUGRSUZ_J01188 [Eucalyptus grandis]|uniref:Uncharacterized protein n=2 Tax=Eucalyptus grandis TaxID=71139 RepID=A0ACC3J4W3_EUCGR|nr:hypothetical protein EUGRSUZ_J01188 [Eucalyptus grandis]